MASDVFSTHRDLEPEKERPDCNGVMRVVEQDGPLWVLECSGCRFVTTVRVRSRERATSKSGGEW